MRISVFFVFMMVAGWVLALPLALSPYLHHPAEAWLRNTFTSYVSSVGILSDARPGVAAPRTNVCRAGAEVRFTLPPRSALRSALVLRV